MNKVLTLICIHCVLWLLLPMLLQAERISIELDDGNTVPVQQFPADGESLIIWLHSEYGASERLIATAQRLADSGLETWLPDLHATWFLPVGPHSLQAISNESLLEILQKTQRFSHKKIYVVAPGRTAASVLQAIHLWQQQSLQSGQLGGVILFHPKLYIDTPQGGEQASFLPVVQATNIPLYLFQPENSAHYWYRRSVQSALADGGAPVFLHDLKQVSDGFYARTDYTEIEANMTRRVPGMIYQAIRRLSDYDVPTEAMMLPPASLNQTTKAEPPVLLKPYDQEMTTPPLLLNTLDDTTVSLNDYMGQVILLNFWATWCPPCVEEIPSLERLKSLRQDKGLAVVSVDVGESADTIRKFLSDKPVSFPVLLDPDARTFKDWNNYAFPTTFILDREHKIRYARFGAVAWDSEEVLTTLDELLNEVKQNHKTPHKTQEN